MTTNFDNDERRIQWLSDHLKRPWTVIEGKKHGHDAWVIKTADGKDVIFRGRGMMCLIAKAVNNLEAKQ